MSAQANIVAFDGAATPVSHTLVPINSSVLPDGTRESTWRESLTTVPEEAQVRIVMRSKRLSSGINQVSCDVSVPVMEAIAGANAAGYTAAPKVAYVNRVVVTSYFSGRATIAERRLVRQLAVNVAGSVSTSVSPVTTGPAPELIDQNIIAS